MGGSDRELFSGSCNRIALGWTLLFARERPDSGDWFCRGAIDLFGSRKSHICLLVQRPDFAVGGNHDPECRAATWRAVDDPELPITALLELVSVSKVSPRQFAHGAR